MGEDTKTAPQDNGSTGPLTVTDSAPTTAITDPTELGDLLLDVLSCLRVTGRLTIPTADGSLLHYSAVASVPLEHKSQAHSAEVPANSCLRRAAALAVHGLELWG